jgi:DNA-binding transcriptional LysR family regulator
MQLVALKYFVAVADHGSFSAAAAWLGVSTSTLTRSVGTLEDDLGLTLFERSRHGVHLAPSAIPVLEETRRMLASLDAVANAAEGAARGIAGELRLGVRSPPLGTRPAASSHVPSRVCIASRQVTIRRLARSVRRTEGGRLRRVNPTWP